METRLENIILDTQRVFYINLSLNKLNYLVHFLSIKTLAFSNSKNIYYSPY